VHASAPTLTRAPEKNSEPLTGPAAPASSDLSFGGAANRKKIAVGELERIAAGDHRVAILEFDETGIHRAVHEDKAELAFPALPVPAIDVRLLAHETSRFRVHQNEHASLKTSKLGPT
jgi:hypothetical protein